MKGQESPDLELAMGRIIARMDLLVESLKSASTRTEVLEALSSMNDLIRKSWAVSTIGYDLGSGICKSLLQRGIMMENFIVPSHFYIVTILVTFFETIHL